MRSDDYLSRVGRLIKSIRYRNGWTFTLDREARSIWTSYTTTDTESGDPFTFNFHTTIDGEPGYVEILLAVWRSVEEIEGHERLESLRIQGQEIWESHPEWYKPMVSEGLVCRPHGTPNLPKRLRW